MVQYGMVCLIWNDKWSAADLSFAHQRASSPYLQTARKTISWNQSSSYVCLLYQNHNFFSESALGFSWSVKGWSMLGNKQHIPPKWARTTMLYIHSQMKKWCGIISGITSKGRRVMFKGTFASQLFLRLALGYTWSDKGWSMLENKELILLFTVCCLVPYLPFLYLISIGGLIPINHSRREPLNRLQ